MCFRGRGGKEWRELGVRLNEGDLGPSGGEFSQSHSGRSPVHTALPVHLSTQLFRCSPSTLLLSNPHIRPDVHQFSTRLHGPYTHLSELSVHPCFLLSLPSPPSFLPFLLVSFPESSTSPSLPTLTDCLSILPLKPQVRS